MDRTQIEELYTVIDDLMNPKLSAILRQLLGAIEDNAEQLANFIAAEKLHKARGKKK